MKRYLTAYWEAMRRTSSILLCVCAVCLCTSGCITSDHPSHEESTFVNVGDMAPDFTTDLIDGGQRTLSSLRGEAVMLIFFSSSCPDCQNQFAELSRLIDEDWPNFKLLAISREETLEETIAFRDKYSFPFEVGLDIDKSIYSLYASLYVPRTFLIDGSGKVVALDIEFDPNNLQSIWDMATNLAN